jgi:hypothetical protein
MNNHTTLETVCTQQTETAILEPLTKCAPPTEEKPIPHPVKSAIRAIFSVVLGILLCVFAVAFVAASILRPESLAGVVADADAAAILGGSEELDTWLKENTLLPDGSSLDLAGVESFISQKVVKEEISKLTTEYLDAVAQGNFDYCISKNDIINILRAVSSEVEEEFGLELTRNDYDIIEEQLNEEQLDMFSVGNLLKTGGVDFKLPVLLFSPYPFIILALLCGVVTTNILFIHRRKIRTAFLNIGIPAALSGLLYFAAGIAFIVSKNLGRYVGGASGFVSISGGILLLTGILLIAAYIVLKSKLDEPKGKTGASSVWKYICLMFNGIALVICAVFIILCATDLPDSADSESYEVIELAGVMSAEEG